MVGTISDKGKKWIPRWWHTCVQGEKLPTRTLSLPWEAFPFLDLRSEGLSNLASLDQTSFLLLYDRGKWKFFPRHEKFVLICILSLYTCMSPSGDSFFSIFRGCSNHKSTIIIAQQNLKRKISGDFFSNFFPLRDRSKIMPFLNSLIKA